MKKLPLLIPFLVLFPLLMTAQSVLTVTSLADNGAGTFRDAVASAASGDTLRFSVRGQITLTSGSVGYNKDLVIVGPGKDSLSISGNGQSQILRITGGNTRLVGLTLRDGFYNAPLNGLDGGGGLYFVGDSLQMSEVCIRECVVRRPSNGAAGRGGGLFAEASKVWIEHCKLTRDTVDVQSGTANGGGAWILSPDLEIRHTVIDSNYVYAERGNTGATSFGGGLYISGGNGTHRLQDCQIHYNNCESRTFFITSNSYDAGNYGGGLYAIDANIMMEDCRVARNWMVASATDDQRFFGAGLALIRSTLTANRVSVALNRSELSAPPALIEYGDGGGVYIDDGGLRMDSSRVDSNFAYRGAGILVSSGNQAPFQGLDLSYTTCKGNISFTPFAGSGPPAACLVFREPTFAQDSFRVNIRFAEISHNNSVGVDIRFPEGILLTNTLIAKNYGGVNLFGASVDPTLFENNTLYDNVSDVGSGIFAFNSGPVLVRHCTFVDDSTTNTSYGREIRAEFASLFQLKGNIFHTTVAHPGSIFSFDGTSTIGSVGGNISRDFSGTATLNQATDLNNTDPQLDVFASHGGPSFSWSLLSGSVAIDHAGADTLGVDQRGFLRDSLLDAGAFEFNAVNPYLPVVAQQTDSLEVCEGDTGYVWVSVAGPRPLDYQWQQNGVDLLGATDSLLAIAGDSLGTDLYRCIVSNIYGQDSSADIWVRVNPVYFTQVQDTICDGDSLFFGGNWLSSTGIYIDSLQTILSCDSVVELDLFVAPVYQFAVVDSVCAGDSLQFQGQYFSSAGQYTVPYLSQYGCDSLYTLDLHVLPLPTVLLNSFNMDSICNNAGALPLPAALPVGGTYYGNGVFGGNFDPSVAGLGQHWVYYSVADSNGCLGTDSVAIFVKNCVGLSDALDASLSIWPNPAADQIFIEFEGAAQLEVSLWDLQGREVLGPKIIFPGKNDLRLPDLVDGIYLLKIQSGSRLFFRRIMVDGRQ